MMQHNVLAAGIDTTEQYVGFRCEDFNSPVEVVLPLGMSNSSSNEEVRLLLQILTKFYGSTDISHQLGETEIQTSELEEAFVAILNEFKIRGVLKEVERRDFIDSKGSIDWHRTLQKIVPRISNGNLVFLKFIISSKNYNEMQKISLINKYCIRIAQKYYGWLIHTPAIDSVSLPISEEASIALIRKELRNTFLDHKKRVLQACLSILKLSHGAQSGKYVFGTANFHLIWERLVEKVFGSEKREEYYPSASWRLWDGNICNGGHLRPDSIIENENNLIILDSKYYKYGVTKKLSDLPGMESIGKQILYKYQVSRHKRVAANVFLLPVNSPREKVIFLGSVEPSWDKGSRILAIGIDTRTLMAEALETSNRKLKNLLLGLISEIVRA